MSAPTLKRRSRPKAAGSVQVRRPSCAFCADGLEDVDYKNAALLRRFISEKGRLRPRRVTGACRRHQLQLTAAVKRAREMALIPYVSGGPSGGHSPGRHPQSRG